MIDSYQGELAALLTAFFWTITALAFESASKKVGSLSVNLLRLLMAFFFLGLFGLFTSGNFRKPPGMSIFPASILPLNFASKKA